MIYAIRKKVILITCLIAAYLILLLGLTLVTGNNSPHHVVAFKGIIDLQHSPEAFNNTCMPIEGELEFYWKKFLQPNDFNTEEPVRYSPGKEWIHITQDGKNLPSQGYATYRLLIMHKPGQDLALLIQRIYSSYRVYINGVSAANAGIPAKTRDSTIPLYKTQTVPIDTTGRTQTEIVIHTANYEQYKGGLCGYEPLYLGTERSVQSLFQRKLYTHVFFLGFLLMGAVLNFILFLSRRTEKPYLYFSLIYLITVTVLYLDMRVFSVTPVYLLSYATREELNYAVQYIGTILYVLFLQKMFNHTIPRPLMAAIITVFSLMALAALTLPSPLSMQIYNVYLIFLSLIFVYFLYILVMVVIKAANVQYIFALAYILLFMSLIFQSYFYQQQAYIFDTIPVLHLHVVLVFLINTVYLALNYRKALDTAHELSFNLEKQVEKRTRELQQSNTIIETVNEEQKALLRLLCHDLSTPFISMRFFTKLLKDSPKTFNQKREVYLTEMQQVMKNGKALLENVRISSEKQKITARPRLFRLSEAVSLAESMSSVFRDKKEIALLVDVDDSLYIYSDFSLFVHSVLLNLIRNAVKFSLPGASIYMAAHKTNDRVIMTIRDEGIGMSREILEKVLTHPAECQRTGTAGEEGTGFGLRLAMKFIELFRGTLALSSRENDGTTVILDLPSSPQPMKN